MEKEELLIMVKPLEFDGTGVAGYELRVTFSP